MRVANYLIDKTGTLIYPTAQINIINNAKHNIANTQITLIFYTGIITNADGSISGTGVVTTGLTGTINVQARSDINDIWTNIENGTLYISTANKCFPSGVIQSLKLTCTGVTGCNYIQVLLDTEV